MRPKWPFCFVFGLTIIATAVPAQETARFSKKVMTVANTGQTSFTLLQIQCDGTPRTNHCIVFGSRIYKQSTKPFLAIGDPATTCYMEVGTTEVDVHEVDGKLVAQDGPGGLCESTIISTFDFVKKTYSFRSFSNNKTGEFCSVQKDQFIQYDSWSASPVQSQMKCGAVEFVGPFWQP